MKKDNDQSSPCGAAEVYRADSLWGQFTNIIEECTGIESVDSFADINIYANHGRIVVEGADSESVQVFDMVGRLVQTFKQSSNQAIPTGIYLVKVGDRQARKVVVMK